MSHIIRPSILGLLKAYAEKATALNVGVENFSDWLEIIQSSLVQMGSLKESEHGNLQG